MKYSAIYESWFVNLTRKEQERLIARISRLESTGPSLGRPLVDRIKGSRFSNMKELRSGTIRVLFIFDPERNCLLLLGGNKKDQWKKWYKENIPVADELYENYLQGQQND